MQNIILPYQKGDVCMQAEIRIKINDLKNRAKQRLSSFPDEKDVESVKVENDFFEDLKEQTYSQIMEEETWN